MTRRLGRPAGTAAILAASALLIVCVCVAQNSPNAEKYKARLSPVPISVSMLATIAGSGALTATLQGKQLTIQGTFEGLRSPATTVQMHRAPKAIPGPVIAELSAGLSVTKAENGAINGTLELTPDQIADLRDGRLYVQIQSQGAPEGNLWGWLLR